MADFQMDWVFRPDLPERRVRFFIFFITGACAGLPALFWSVGELIEHRKNGLRISVFIILLLLTDFAEFLLTPYILIKYLINELDWILMDIWSLWWSLRVCGLLLNQLVALDGILSVRYPLYTAAVFSTPRFRTLYTLVFLVFTICLFLFSVYSFVLVMIFCFIVFMIPWIISCRASGSSERHSHTSRKPDLHIWVIFILTLLVLYLPLILGLLLLITINSYCILYLVYVILLLTSVRLISDPLLCVLVCRQNLRLQISQKAEETSVVYMNIPGVANLGPGEPQSCRV